MSLQGASLCTYCLRPMRDHDGDQCPISAVPGREKVLCIDPGEQHVAVSVWAARELLALELYRMAHTRGSGLGWVAMGLAEQVPTQPDTVVVEEMVYYVEGRTDTKQAEFAKTAALLRLAFISGFVAGWVQPGQCMAYPAREWKGQVPKEITKRRVENTLVVAELEVYHAALAKVPESLGHNLVDAVGLGLYHFRRK